MHWVRRAWALAEVVGATGKIVVNNTEVSADTKQIVDAYNLAMASVGIKNLTKESYKLIKKLSNKNIALKLVKSANEKPILEIVEEGAKIKEVLVDGNLNFLLLETIIYYQLLFTHNLNKKLLYARN